MDVTGLEGAVRQFLIDRARQSPPPRYLSVAFSATKQGELDTLKAKLSQLLRPISVWEKPGQDGAPAVPISRNEFCTRLFSEPHPNGILVYLPEEWMIGWSNADRRVFWTSLAETFGRNRVVVVFTGTPATLANVENYLQRTETFGPAVHVYTSKYER